MCPQKCDVVKVLSEQLGDGLARISLPRVAVGGAVEKLLTAVGVTKERVQQWTQLSDCGCAARQRWLDQWGYAQQEKIERILNKAARFYFGESADPPETGGRSSTPPGGCS